ncbi:MAG: hypothetical protein AAF658_06725, partial [Myxococcota bacterium]
LWPPRRRQAGKLLTRQGQIHWGDHHTPLKLVLHGTYFDEPGPHLIDEVFGSILDSLDLDAVDVLRADVKVTYTGAWAHRCIVAFDKRARNSQLRQPDSFEHRGEALNTYLGRRGPGRYIRCYAGRVAAADRKSNAAVEAERARNLERYTARHGHAKGFKHRGFDERHDPQCTCTKQVYDLVDENGLEWEAPCPRCSERRDGANGYMLHGVERHDVELERRWRGGDQPFDDTLVPNLSKSFEPTLLIDLRAAQEDPAMFLLALHTRTLGQQETLSMLKANANRPDAVVGAYKDALAALAKKSDWIQQPTEAVREQETHVKAQLAPLLTAIADARHRRRGRDLKLHSEEKMDD